MGNARIVIESITIKNFRSIRNVTLVSKNLNIFVGINDVGKSNFLKAMNLFFNNETDYKTPFDFKRDFTYLFPDTSHSTKEIKIVIKFLIPNSYKEKGTYTWEKIWRTDDYFDENFYNSAGQKPPMRSRVPSTLRRIKYRYVPAVKSENYYKTLLSDLYLTVSASLSSPLGKTTDDFSAVLKEYTHAITDNVLARVGISSQLTIPEDLREIFRALIFETKSDEIDRALPLNVRGDGIQARHIPIILKYIADEDQKSRNQGSMKISTIWGYEEPENGVELAKAFAIADEFIEYSEGIQLFVTTHSPAFYMKNASAGTAVFYAIKKPQNEGTAYTSDKNSMSICENMGLMPLIAPFVAEKMDEINRIKSISKENILDDIDTILVEGKTDKAYLELAIRKLSPELQRLIDEDALRIFVKEGRGGVSQIADWAISWSYSGNTHKLFVLFDKDAAGTKAKAELETNEAFKHKKSSVQISTQFLQPSDEILKIISKNIAFQFEIEHLLSIDFWKTLKLKNYVIARDFAELSLMFQARLCREKTLDNIIDDTVDDVDLRDTIVTFNPLDEKKEQIKNLVEKEIEANPDSSAVNGFKKTIEKIARFFIK